MIGPSVLIFARQATGPSDPVRGHSGGSADVLYVAEDHLLHGPVGCPLGMVNFLEVDLTILVAFRGKLGTCVVLIISRSLIGGWRRLHSPS